MWRRGNLVSIKIFCSPFFATRTSCSLCASFSSTSFGVRSLFFTSNELLLQPQTDWNVKRRKAKGQWHQWDIALRHINGIFWAWESTENIKLKFLWVVHWISSLKQKSKCNSHEHLNFFSNFLFLNVAHIKSLEMDIR